MKIRFMKHLLCIAAVALICAASAASADELFTQTKDNYSGYYSSIARQQVADDFSLASGGTIEKVTWWGFYASTDPVYAPTPPTDNFTMRFYSNVSGLPGSILQSYSIGSSVIRTDTGVNTTLNDKDIYKYEYDMSATPFDAAAGTTYWLSILGVNDSIPGYPDNWAWQDNERVDYPVAYRFFESGTWQDSAGNRAFILEGVPGELQPVPEPATLILLVSGLVGLAGFKKRFIKK